MKIRAIPISALTVLLLCASVFAEPCFFICGSPREHLGDAFKAQRESQILNPDARWHTEPMEGLDGSAAAHVATRYHESFKKPVQTQTGGVSTIGLFPVMTGSGGGARY